MTGARVAVEPALPRGRHGLPKGEIVAHQRERLLRSLGVEIRDQGYSSLSVADVVARAGVSRRTFYQLFDDKLDCVLAAHRAAASRLEWLVSEARATAADGPTGAAAGVALPEGSVAIQSSPERSAAPPPISGRTWMGMCGSMAPASNQSVSGAPLASNQRAAKRPTAIPKVGAVPAGG